MPCPYFFPVDPLVWPSAPKLPLGDAYTGFCRADPAAETNPPSAALVDLCNLGYARDRCPRFPQHDGPDAVRFAVARVAEDSIAILWVRERDHHPFDHGRLEYSPGAASFATAPADPIMLRQAHAYVATYLRRTRKEK